MQPPKKPTAHAAGIPTPKSPADKPVSPDKPETDHVADAIDWLTDLKRVVDDQNVDGLNAGQATAVSKRLDEIVQHLQDAP